jgi:lipoic acid synthetase
MSRLPSFLIKRIPKQENIRRIRSLLNDPSVHTVCEEARCPNIGECFSQKTCTFLILGNTCTRNCAFCGVDHGKPQPPDPTEPERIAQAVKKLGLKYVVITSVTRDDLPDGGAGHFAAVISALRATSFELRVEVLVPDFLGSLHIVLDAKPYVLNHNLETVPRLYPKIRPQANYERSLKILRAAKDRGIYSKSGFMVGLGETGAEVAEVLMDLTAVNCDIVTIGQYLPPSKFHLRPERYVTPEEFDQYRAYGETIGLKVLAGPFVRSSYHADKVISDLRLIDQ